MSDKRKIVEEYCYGKACGLSSTWPELNSSVSEEDKVLIDDACDKLIEVDIPRSATLDKLGTSSGSYILMLRCILAIYEEEHHKAQQNQEIKPDIPRLFALAPSPSFKFRSVSITPAALKSFTSEFKKLQSTFGNNQNMFFKIFDLAKLKLKNINELDTNTDHRKEVFSNLLRTDEYSADVVIYKKNRTSEGSHDMAYDMNDLHVAITENRYDLETLRLTGLDPGRNSVFTAAYGGDNGAYQVRDVQERDIIRILDRQE
ncbi:hypothetical protein RMATCC62417_17726 [Rhizopus microsporus]|nr:hypothetical protein RMATCC62417_17726 [Rhizopus microsporus]